MFRALRGMMRGRAPRGVEFIAYERRVSLSCPPPVAYTVGYLRRPTARVATNTVTNFLLRPSGSAIYSRVLIPLHVDADVPLYVRASTLSIATLSLPRVQYNRRGFMGVTCALHTHLLSHISPLVQTLAIHIFSTTILY